MKFFKKVHIHIGNNGHFRIGSGFSLDAIGGKSKITGCKYIWIVRDNLDGIVVVIVVIVCVGCFVNVDCYFEFRSGTNYL
mgnify:CR=1 FL=1